jgi:hypothetical protein
LNDLKVLNKPFNKKAITILRKTGNRISPNKTKKIKEEKSKNPKYTDSSLEKNLAINLFNRSLIIDVRNLLIYMLSKKL